MQFSEGYKHAVRKNGRYNWPMGIRGLQFSEEGRTSNAVQ